MTYLRFPWAISNGDKVEPPAEEQVDDSVSYEEGYSSRYSEDPATSGTAKRIERNEYNGALFRYSTEIQQYQQNGFPNFIPSSENGSSPFPYALNSILRIGTSIFQSNTAANVTTPPDASWDDVTDSIRNKTPTAQDFVTPGAIIWNKPAGCKYIFYEVLGAGGGGGGTGPTSAVTKGGGGGGGGGFSKGILNVISISSLNGNIGAGGAGGTGTGGGDDGTSTTFDSVTCNGGEGGNSAVDDSIVGGLSGNGGTASSTLGTGIINITGGAGGQPSPASVQSGFGGGTYYGPSVQGVTADVGVDALDFGCGGGGGTERFNDGPFAGGSGLGGRIYIVEFY